MDSLGFVEVKGIVAMNEAADAGAKAADVKLRKKVSVGAGLMTIVFSGDIGAVKTAVDVAITAAKRVGQVSGFHVIAKPTQEMQAFLDL
jgi:ethanolamine utilization protein EutM